MLDQFTMVMHLVWQIMRIAVLSCSLAGVTMCWVTVGWWSLYEDVRCRTCRVNKTAMVSFLYNLKVGGRMRLRPAQSRGWENGGIFFFYQLTHVFVWLIVTEQPWEKWKAQTSGISSSPFSARPPNLPSYSRLHCHTAYHCRGTRSRRYDSTNSSS